MTDTLPSAPAPQVGTNVRRKQGDLVLTGRGYYVDDVTLPGMLHMAVLRSPYAHARLVRVAATGGRPSPGVRGVVTGEEALDLVGPIPPFYDPAAVGGRAQEFRCLAVGKVTHAGEAGAAGGGGARGRGGGAPRRRGGGVGAAAGGARRRRGAAQRRPADLRGLGRQRR